MPEVEHALQRVGDLVGLLGLEHLPLDRARSGRRPMPSARTTFVTIDGRDEHAVVGERVVRRRSSRARSLLLVPSTSEGTVSKLFEHVDAHVGGVRGDPRRAAPAGRP